MFVGRNANKIGLSGYVHPEMHGSHSTPLNRKTILSHQRMTPPNFALEGHCPQPCQVATIPRSTTGYNQPLFFQLEIIVKISRFKLGTGVSCLGGTLQSQALVPALQLTDSTTTSDSLRLLVQEFPFQYLPHISLHEETEASRSSFEWWLQSAWHKLQLTSISRFF